MSLCLDCKTAHCSCYAARSKASPVVDTRRYERERQLRERVRPVAQPKANPRDLPPLARKLLKRAGGANG